MISIALPLRRLALASAVLSSLAAPARAQSACPLWQPPFSYVNSPLRIVAGDFNGDGGVDCAVGQLPAAFSLGLRTPFGTYPPTLPYVLMPVATEVLVAGDLNGDQALDLVAGGSGLHVVIGNGDGTFQAPVAITGVGAYCRNVELVDLDGDSDLDAVLVLPTTLQLAVLLGNGSGGFGAPTFLAMPAGDPPYDVEVQPFDGDGIHDVVVSRSGLAQALFLHGLGGGAFSAPAEIPMATNGAVEIASADFDADGVRDFALASTTALTVLRGDGSGGFATLHAAALPNNAQDMVAGDLDGDGRPDLAITGFNGSVALVRNLGSGSFAAPRVFAGVRDSRALALADVNQDGALDALVAGKGEVRYLLGDGDGGLRSPEILCDQPGSGPATPCLRSARLDGDALDDVLYFANGQRLVARLADGAGGLGPVLSTPLPGPAGWMRVGNVDGDPHIDVYFDSGNQVVTGRGVGNGTFQGFVATTLSSFPYGVAGVDVGDVTGDGQPDVVLGEHQPIPFPPWIAGTRLRILPGTAGGGFGAPIDLVTGKPTSQLVVGDLDGQLGLDIVALHSGSPPSGVVARSLGGGSFALLPLAITTGFSSPRLADLDGDTLLDLAGTGASTYWFHGNGDGTFGPQTAEPGASGSTLAVGDLDGNGTHDLAVLDSAFERLWFVPGNGAGGFGPSCQGLGGGGNSQDLVAVDLDGDGLDELVVGHYGEFSGVSVRRNELVAALPHVYCSSKLNSLGCLPQIAFAGSPSAAATSGFTVSCSQVRNNKPGLLLYGVSGRASLPFSGGTLCIASPVRRSPMLSSGGSPAGTDCTGVYAIDASSFAAGLLGGNPSPALRSAGTVAVCQFWGRDPGFPPPNATTLSDALEFTVAP